MTNAIRHNDQRGRVAVTVAAERGQAVLTVANTGPRVTPDHVDMLFEPFARGAGRTHHDTHHDSGERRTGHGLGLAIVHAVVTAHHGTLSATADPAGGLTVEVRLQKVAPPPGPPPVSCQRSPGGFTRTMSSR
ncbi:sensor histidine kinase [Nonomuraea lactucae]|uniref:sensor histidine kinase n=1 Tax=Nonomuraea lactucae TaxID=2249762 RepID=UPI0013B3F7B1|nr:ATP-binding protein [Nonomuraea lactucae]